MQTITPHLWFDKEAREAAEFYASILPGSGITSTKTLNGTPSGNCEIVSFKLAGQPFVAISAGPLFKFNPSVSFHLKCGTKEEVDSVWARLSPGGKVLMPLDSYPFSERFGWVEDQYGLSWQVIYVGDNSLGQRIIPALMFAGAICGKAEEAINFYAGVFQGSPYSANMGENKAEVLARYGESSGPDQGGTVQYSRFVLGGQEFGAMDSARSHNFAFNEAISFLVPCDTQEEIDYFWQKLSADPQAEQCGWLKDRYGLSWQVGPAVLQKLLNADDRARTERVTEAMLQMKKLDIGALQQAAESELPQSD